MTVFRMIPAGPRPSDFGSSIAISGDFAVVGGPDADDGSAHVFERNGGTWQQVTRLLPPTNHCEGTPGRFGESVAIFHTGHKVLVVIGANGDDDAADDAGAV